MDEVKTIEESEIMEIIDTSELEKMDVEKVKKKKEGKKKTVKDDIEIIEVIDTQKEGKKNKEKKEKMKVNVAVEINNEEQNSDNNFTAKNQQNEEEKQKEPEIKLNEKEEEIKPNEKKRKKKEKKEKDDKENVKKMEEQSTTNTDEGNVIVLKKEQGNKENANKEKNNEKSRKRKREPKDNEKTNKKDQALRDKCTLFIRFPESFVVKKQSHLNEVKELATATIRFPNVPRGSRKGFCYAEYKTEEEAKRVKEVMEKREINGEYLQVEFLAGLSQLQQSQLANTVDPLSLFVGRLPKWIKEDTVRAFFPTAIEIKCTKGKKFSHRNAIVTFKTEDEAKRVVNVSKGLKIGNSEVIIMFVNKNHKHNEKNEKEDIDVLPKPAKRLKKEEVAAMEINVSE